MKPKSPNKAGTSNGAMKLWAIVGQHYYGGERRESAEEKTERIVMEELGKAR
jgi:hypothetical protein